VLPQQPGVLQQDPGCGAGVLGRRNICRGRAHGCPCLMQPDFRHRLSSLFDQAAARSQPLYISIVKYKTWLPQILHLHMKIMAAIQAPTVVFTSFVYLILKTLGISCFHYRSISFKSSQECECKAGPELQPQQIGSPCSQTGFPGPGPAAVRRGWGMPAARCGPLPRRHHLWLWIFILFFFFSFFLSRSQMLQQHRSRLPGNGERDPVGAAVPAVELAVPPHAHLHRRPVPRAQRGSLLLPQPRQPEGRPVVLHLRRELQV